MASSYMAFQVSCSIQGRPSLPANYENLKTTFSSLVKPLLRSAVQQVDHVSKTIKNGTAKMLDDFVDSAFEFVDQPLLPSQSNFAPVDELGGPVVINNVKGNIPDNFPEGVYIRNGSNPLFGGLKSTKSVFGKSNHTWVEGEGMLHALYFSRDDDRNRTLHYNNRYVETETFKQDKQRTKPSFIPIMEGDVTAVISAIVLNLMRYGKIVKYLSNTNVFEHSGKVYSVAEDYMPQEIDISTLKTLGNMDLSGAWNRACTSHPKIAPGTGELVIIGMDAIKPYYELGVISADGKELVHRADLKLDRCTFSHDFGITERLMKYNKEEYARIGVMPRHGDGDSIKWFEVEPNCTFHIINCFEDGDDEVVVWGCRSLESVIPGPGLGPSKEKFDTSIKDGLLYDRPYEWRLNMQTGKVRERNLTADTEFSMDFPMINPSFTGLKNKFGYTQVVHDSRESSPTEDNMPRFSGLAKLHFEQLDERFSTTTREIEEVLKVEYHMFEENTFCTGAAFVAKKGGLEEDDGWIVTFVHNEATNISQVFLIDAQKFSGEPVARITLPCRVPYGFHGAFIPISP
ncbi:hypothetical protein L484_008741 [Morus notabilis]|uniref:Carotenoid 9,10(9',10')-cleavage dioxygenase 1 n=1 Tax=Morus notabilis TaxID=981085 RepID=W9R8U4_9ROSA|nr:hypothetical protein L484_008741 [Morus notabilis]